MWFQLGLNKTFCPTSTIIHQRFKHHQREKLTKIHFLPPPHWFSTQSSQYQYWTANKVFHPDGNRTWTISRSSQLLKTLCHCPPPWIDQYKVQIGLYNSKLHWTLFFTFLHGDYWPPCSFFHMKIKFSWRWQITSKYNNKKFLAW